MIGHQMMSNFEKIGIDVTGTTRREDSTDANTVKFNVVEDSIATLLDSFPSTSVVVNNIGVIKSNITDGDSTSEINAIKVNSLFPHELAKAASQRGIHVIQIATDCVYSGQLGQYNESSKHDAWDVYGKTKSLGEVNAPNMTLLRCSVIGREQGRSSNLIEWVLSQPENAQLSGYTNHLWNGLSTLAFSQICAGIINNKNFEPGVHHVVPTEVVSKQQLVEGIARAFGREDISVSPVETPVSVDRTLSTEDKNYNTTLWNQAGYSEIPSVTQLLKEYAQSLNS
jgi:dTDP-4-dehydrorhamnose reductase